MSYDVESAVFAKALPRAELVRNIWALTLPDDVDWRDALRPQFWSKVSYKLRDGDRIEIRTFDYRVQFCLHIFEINDRLGYIDAVGQPLCPPGLELPPFGDSGERPRYRIKQMAASNLFEVLDDSGTILKTDLDRAGASEDRDAREAAFRSARDAGMRAAAVEPEPELAAAESSPSRRAARR